MRQTLFVIPHEFLATWLMPLWIVIVVIGFVFLVMRKRAAPELIQWGIAGAVGIAVIRFVIPAIEIEGYSLEPPHRLVPLGLAIRGYGVMFLLAVVAGVGLVLVRARQMQVDPDLVVSLAFWVFLAGIIGARAFYVIEYREQFQAPTIAESLARVVNTTSGGLVVYGSFIGGMGAVLAFAYRHKFPLLALADLVVPGMTLGLALGRIGCFLNGCCYGGLCETPLGVEFPRTAGAYAEQLESGLLVGITSRVVSDDPKTLEVVSVENGSEAEKAGFAPGDRYSPYQFSGDAFERATALAQSDRTELYSLISVDGIKRLSVPLLQLPPRSRPVHPTQLYATIGAILLTFVLWYLYPLRYGDGEVLGWAVVLYGAIRFLEESIRVDEMGQFGTSLSISQWTSLVLFPVGLGLIAWARLSKRPLALPPPPINSSQLA